MSKHTPGPWNVFYKSKYDEWHVSVPMSSGSMKWALFNDGIHSENPEADARLIAAAPDALEAAEIAIIELQAVEREIGVASKALPLLRAFVAKATGCES